MQELFQEIEDNSDRRGAIIVACFATNVARIETIALAARSIGRHVSVTGRSLYSVRDVATLCGYLDDYDRHDPLLDAAVCWDTYPREKQVCAHYHWCCSWL